MSIWFTVEEFCRRFADHQALIDAIVDMESKPACFRDYILRVGDRHMYAEDCRENDKMSCLHELDHPLIDKKHNLVFEVDEGGHEYLRSELMEVYEERGDRELVDLAYQYVTKGYGYFNSSVSRKGMMIGQTLFDRELLDEDDAAILGGWKLEIIGKTKGHP